MGYLGISIYQTISCVNEDIYFFVLIWITLISIFWGFSPLITLAKLSTTVLNSSGKRGHPCLVPDLRVKHLWHKSHLVMRNNHFNVAALSLLIFCWEIFCLCVLRVLVCVFLVMSLSSFVIGILLVSYNEFFPLFSQGVCE